MLERFTPTKIKRVISGGWKNFIRGGAVSAATVLIMTVTLAVICFLIFLSSLLSFTLNTIKNKVDISVYFFTTVSEAEILSVKDRLEQLPQVASVTYSSREQELAEFRARHANNQIILQGLDELGENPLSPALEVLAKDPSQYESIVNYLESSPMLSASGTSLISDINYGQNKEVIDRLTLAITATRNVGFTVVALFALASILIAFATIRLAIYTAKDEIAVMRLVGASGAYVQGPFIVTGVITGIVAALIVLILLWPTTWYVGAKTVGWFGGWSVASYYAGNFMLISGILLGAGVVLGAAASVLAIHRYLKV